MIGWGSLLHGDDGAGPRVVEAVARLAGERCDCVAVLQLVPELAPRLAAAAAAVLVDAAAADPPGQVAWQVLRPRGGAGADEGSLSHELTPPTLVDLARQLFGRAPEVALVNILGASFELAEDLSPEVARAIEPAARAIVQWLDERAQGGSA